MADGFSGYAIVEVMGHNRYVGHVEETTLAGAGMLKLTVPPIAGDETRAPRPMLSARYEDEAPNHEWIGDDPEGTPLDDL